MFCLRMCNYGRSLMTMKFCLSFILLGCFIQQIELKDGDGSSKSGYISTTLKTQALTSKDGDGSSKSGYISTTLKTQALTSKGTSTPVPAPAPASSTPAPATTPALGRIVYKFVRRRKTWLKAQRSCRRWGGHLATVSSPEQNNYLYKETISRRHYTSWIGLRVRARNGTFVWADPKSKGIGYRNWNFREPNMKHIGESCVAIISLGVWNDTDCMSKYASICQKIDIDECRTLSNVCHQNATCTNTIHSFTCTCTTGLVGNGNDCFDVNECASSSKTCHQNATCINTFGSFTCTCNTGFAGNGTICVDVNECASSSKTCHQNATCINTFGSFTCTCNAGFAGNGTNCVDVNECTSLSNPCHQNATCTNNVGSFTCTCNPGYLGNGTNCVEWIREELIGELHEIKKNKQITVLDTVDKEYRVVVEFFSRSGGSGWKNIIHFTKGPTTAPSTLSSGDFIPAVWSHSSNKIQVSAAVNISNNLYRIIYGVSEDTWHSINITQQKKGKRYHYSIVVDGKTIFSTINSKPKTFRNIRVYASSPWYSAQNGFIRKLDFYRKAPTTATAPAPTTATAPAPTTATAPAPTTATAPDGFECSFTSGDGHGGTEIKIGSQTGEDCVKACVERRRSDQRINGVTVYSYNRGGCWCEQNMDRVQASTRYKTCFLISRGGSICVYANTDYEGHDIDHRVVTSSFACREYCREITRCQAWTWRTSDRSCMRKTSDSGRRTLTNHLSGRRNCDGPSEIRFPKPVHDDVNGRLYIQGHVEILHNNQWGTICDDYFDNNGAKVICKMAGYKDGRYHTSYKQSEARKASKIWLDDVKCLGSESDISNCPHRAWGENNCDYGESVGIRCFIGGLRFPNPIRGYDNNQEYIQGHVEIFHDNRWGTICDDMFDNNDAKVICKMAGYKDGVYKSSYKQTLVQKASKIWLDDVQCNGRESHINECRHRPWGLNNCGSSEDVGIRCYVSAFRARTTRTTTTTTTTITPTTTGGSTVLGSVRFPKTIRGQANGRLYIQGHVEIYHNNQWGTICDDGFDSNDANVICRMAGLEKGSYNSAFKQPSATKARKIWVTNIDCAGIESNIKSCRYRSWNPTNCNHWEDVGIRCFFPGATGRIRFPNPVRGDENGRRYIQGHVEIFNNNQWGTICDDDFDSNDAKVICRMAGHLDGNYRRSYKQPHIRKAAKIWLTNLECTGTELIVNDCQYRLWSPSNCYHSEDVGIRCYTSDGSHAIRFPSRISGVINGRRYIQGHVEIFHNNLWGTICDDGFDSNDARVICRMAGFKDGSYRETFKQRLANKARKIWLSNVQCSGTERNLGACSNYNWNTNDCQHWEDVGIRCYHSEAELISATKETKASVNMAGLISGIIGTIIFITIIVACKRCTSSTQTSHPVPYHTEDQQVNLQELPPLMSDVTMDTPTSQIANGIHGSNLSISLSAPLDEEEHELPQDSILTEISDGPPRYRSIFPPGHVPITSDEGLPPPPSYEDATT